MFTLSLRSSINIVCCGVVHRCSHTARMCIHDDKLVTRYKDVSEHNRDCNGDSSAMSKVEGSWTWLSGVCSTTLTYMYHDKCIVIHTRMHITGRFKGYFLSVHMANLSATG